MVNTIAKDRQTIIDIAMQQAGSAESAFDLALINGRSLTDELVVGDSLQNSPVATAKVSQFFKTEKKSPASAITQLDSSGVPIEVLEGIGYWIIGIDFKVS